MDSAFLNESEIEAGLPHILASPRDVGRVEAIFLRPSEGERASPESVYLSPEDGVQGDRWASTSGRRLPDGRPDPSIQVSLMNARVLDLLAGTREKWPLAGDNLIVDLDLSEENVPAGQRLAIDDVLLEVTEVPHTGCRKFIERYGKEATGFVNAADRKDLHLRGVFARVLKAGNVNVGSAIRKVDVTEG